MYFSKAKRILCVAAHSKHRLCTDSKVVLFATADALYVSRLTLSANPIADSFKSSRFRALSNSLL